MDTKNIYRVYFSDRRPALDFDIGYVSDWQGKVTFFDSCSEDAIEIAVFDWSDIAGYFKVEALCE